MLISHTHWDHIQGIPFFTPFFIPGNEWDIYAPQGFGETLKATLAGQMEYPYFPITPDAFGAAIRYHNVSEGIFQIGDVRIRTRFLNHPALTIAYRIEADGAAVVYACDHEPHSHDAALAVSSIAGQDEAHSEFLRGADLVIHDAQYTAAEYPTKSGWGHSTFEYAVAVCERAGVRQLALTHHDPLRDDEAVDRVVAAARARLSKNSRLEVFAAAEGLDLEVMGPETEAHSTPSPTAPSEQRALITSRTVLVVSRDHKFFAKVADAAGDEGLTTQLVASGEEAANVCRATLPPLMIVDGELPLDVTAPLMTSSAAVPILLVGGDVQGSDSQSIEYLATNFSREYLRSRIMTWLMRWKYASVAAAMPEDEANRLAALRSTQLLDSPR
jgi:phosphoribosyl 1,2-cyclic phosphodiesterase/CheY-like chemotaxis protein